jgi:L-asparaginase
LLPDLNKYNFDRKYLGSFDSTEMNFEMRKKIAKEIYENYENYSGFIVTHGTDTMADTASAMSYLLQGLDKPVVFTGSQIPIREKDTDAKRNVYNSFRVANSSLEGSLIVFDGKIIQGNRSTKIDANAHFAFDSPKVDKLGEVSKYGVSHNQKKSTKFKLEHFDNFALGVYQFSSGSSDIEGEILESILKRNDVPGVIFSAYGVGNVEKNIQNHFVWQEKWINQLELLLRVIPEVQISELMPLAIGLVNLGHLNFMI